jgi:glycosyltransferase involved in cell wall biosynthesis
VRFDLQALSDLGFRVDLLALPFGKDLPIANVRRIRPANPFRTRQIPIGPSLRKAVFDLILLYKALRLISRNRYDFVHCVEDAGLIGSLVRRIHGCPFVFERHSDPASHKKGPLRNLFLSVYTRVDAWVVRAADAVVTSPALVPQARAIAPEQSIHSVFSIPSSLAEPDAEAAAAIARRLKQGEDEVLITYAGSFAVYQGIELMFEAMQAVVRRDPRARFLIIGGTPGEIAKRKQWLARRGMEDAVTFVGMVDPDEVPNYLAASDVLLSPRLAGKNSPIKLLDYLKAGSAIVATDNHANRAYLDDSNSVLTKQTAEGFADGITRLVRDPELRQRLARVGRKAIDELYNYDEFRRRIGICYAELQRNP